MRTRAIALLALLVLVGCLWFAVSALPQAMAASAAPVVWPAQAPMPVASPGGAVPAPVGAPTGTATAGAATAAQLENRNARDATSAPVLREVDPLETTILVRNPHDRAVRIEKLDPSCSCARLEIDDRFLLPHGSTLLHVKVLNTDKSDDRKVGITCFLTDPDLEPIEVTVLWRVRPVVGCDLLPPNHTDLTQRPDAAWRDIRMLTANERPDEMHRLRKRLRVFSPPEETPPGGLQVTGVDYAGAVWAFAMTPQPDGSTVILATAKDVHAKLSGEWSETATIRTNHPDRPRIELRFETRLGTDAGRAPVDPFAP